MPKKYKAREKRRVRVKKVCVPAGVYVKKYM